VAHQVSKYFVSIYTAEASTITYGLVLPTRSTSKIVNSISSRIHLEILLYFQHLYSGSFHTKSSPDPLGFS